MVDSHFTTLSMQHRTQMQPSVMHLPWMLMPWMLSIDRVKHDAQTISDIAEHQVFRFLSTRWLSIMPVVERLLEQWDAFNIMHPAVAKQDCTKCILSCLWNSVIHAKLSFLSTSLPKFKTFEKRFKSSEGKIHLLHMETCELLKQH